ncbi:MAG: PilZ domain-containing protein [Candidatus Omnitrophica bacterium]|nr:PilZ domain-containing protein [Candidatus Omnitrophota bacterium]
MHERRRYVRANGLVLVNFKIHQHQLQGKCSAFDVSGTGVRITAEQKVNIGAEAEMEIYLPGSSQPILAKGKVIWTEKAKESPATQISAQKEYFYVGVEFTVITVKNKEKIVNYVNRKLH